MKLKILLGLAAAFLVMQAFRPTKNVSAVGSFTGKDDITVLHPTPPEVRQTLATACYDCHSNQTRYPWYAEIQPVGWWLTRHVNEAKGELNFAEFGRYSRKAQLKLLEEVVDEVHDREMPLKSYTWIHREAKLTDAQTKALTNWADGIAEKLGEQ